MIQELCGINTCSVHNNKKLKHVLIFTIFSTQVIFKLGNLSISDYLWDRTHSLFCQCFWSQIMSHSASSRFNSIELSNSFIHSYHPLTKLLWLLIDSSTFVALVNGGCGGGGANASGHVSF